MKRDSRVCLKLRVIRQRKAFINIYIKFKKCITEGDRTHIEITSSLHCIVVVPVSLKFIFKEQEILLQLIRLLYWMLCLSYDKTISLLRCFHNHRHSYAAVMSWSICVLQTREKEKKKWNRGLLSPLVRWAQFLCPIVFTNASCTAVRWSAIKEHWDNERQASYGHYAAFAARSSSRAKGCKLKI